MFSTFGPWDKEVRQFIDDVSKHTQATKADIEAWFYKEGILIFQEVQSTSYGEDVKACQKKYGHRPIMTSAGMLGNVFMAFSKLRDEFFKCFPNASVVKPEYIVGEFNFFIAQAVTAHLSYYEVLADVTNDLHQHLDTNPDISPALIPDLMIGYFKDYKIQKPALAAEIDANILLANELMVYTKTQNTASAVSSSVTTQNTQAIGAIVDSAKLKKESRESSSSTSSTILPIATSPRTRIHSFLAPSPAAVQQESDKIDRIFKDVLDGLQIQASTKSTNRP